MVSFSHYVNNVEAVTNNEKDPPTNWLNVRFLTLLGSILPNNDDRSRVAFTSISINKVHSIYPKEAEGFTKTKSMNKQGNQHMQLL